jgi:hypothetical protein
MKRTPLKKKGTQKISVIQRQLWAECRRVADLMYPNDCYTCEAKNLQGSNKQLGHVPWPKSVLGAATKYDMRFLRWQCMRCNIHGGGMGAVAYERMVSELGQEYVNEMKRDSLKTVKALDQYLLQLSEYKQVL